MASPDPTLIGTLYTRLTSPPKSHSHDDSQVSLRLRDVLMKEWTIIGIPPVLIAVAALANTEGNVATASERSTLSDQW